MFSADAAHELLMPTEKNTWGSPSCASWFRKAKDMNVRTGPQTCLLYVDDQGAAKEALVPLLPGFQMQLGQNTSNQRMRLILNFWAR
jgi:hypothetical protein